MSRNAIDAQWPRASAAERVALESRAREIDRQIQNLTAKIDQAMKEIKVLQTQILALEHEIAKLDQDKKKAVASIRAQKQKAVAQAVEAQGSALARVTPAPTPKKP